MDRDQIQRTFGLTMRELRLRAGLTQEKLAREAGVDRAYVGRLERGRHTPTLETACMVLSPLNVTLPEFFRELDQRLRT